MPAGDVSKGLVSKVRAYLGDTAGKKIPVDLLIYDRLSFYQDYIMTVMKVSRLRTEYPLITDQSEYPFLTNILEITNIAFNEDIVNIPRWYISNTTSGDDSRQFVLTSSDTFVTGTDFMTVHAFTRPTTAQKITKIVDPIIEVVYYDLMIEYTILYFQSEKKFEMIQKQTEEIAEAIRSVNRAEALPLFTNGVIA